MSRKYWKACEMVQGGIRLSLVQLLITPGEKEGEGREESEGKGGRESGEGRLTDFRRPTYLQLLQFIFNLRKQ